MACLCRAFFFRAVQAEIKANITTSSSSNAAHAASLRAVAVAGAVTVAAVLLSWGAGVGIREAWSSLLLLCNGPSRRGSVVMLHTVS